MGVKEPKRILCICLKSISFLFKIYLLITNPLFSFILFLTISVLLSHVHQWRIKTIPICSKRWPKIAEPNKEGKTVKYVWSLSPPDPGYEMLNTVPIDMVRSLCTVMKKSAMGYGQSKIWKSFTSKLKKGRKLDHGRSYLNQALDWRTWHGKQ